MLFSDSSPLFPTPPSSVQSGKSIRGIPRETPPISLRNRVCLSQLDREGTLGVLFVLQLLHRHHHDSRNKCQFAYAPLFPICERGVSHCPREKRKGKKENRG